MPIRTLNQALIDAIQVLYKVSDAPRKEVELLIEHFLGFSRSMLRTEPNLLLKPEQQLRLDEAIHRRQAGEPLAYILGEQEFWSLRLLVTPDVLIPRPETELVVERALAHWPPGQSPAVLDLGTGSGAIALSIAVERPMSRIIATDKSGPALAVAKENAKRLALGNIEFIRSDWYAALDGPFDLIVSNPPYIAAGDPDLDPQVLASEPRDALIGGSAGLEAIETIVKGAPGRLRVRGWLILEHGWRQAAAVRTLLVSAGFSSVASHADLAGHERVTEGQWTG